jgi:hypothetical protein
MKPEKTVESSPRSGRSLGLPLRLGLLAGLLFVFFMLGSYGARHHPWLSYGECLANPGACDGRLVAGFREPMVGAIRSDGFELMQRGFRPVFVKTDTAGLKKGEFISLRAVFHKQGYLTATVAKIASRRREKMGLSLIPAVLGCVLFFRRFRFRPRRMEFEVRSGA